MGRLQPCLKVVYYNFFYCCSILVVLCKAVAIPGPLKKVSPLTKSGHLVFKNVIKKGKILKTKPQTAINQHHAFVAVFFLK